MFGKTGKNIEFIMLTLIRLGDKLDRMEHDLQQIKTSQRASQKRERKTLKKVKTP